MPWAQRSGERSQERAELAGDRLVAFDDGVDEPVPQVPLASEYLTNLDVRQPGGYVPCR